MTQIINALKSSDIRKGYYEISARPYGKIVASQEGMQLMESDPEQTEHIIDGLFRRLCDFQKADPSDSRFEKKHLSPHITGISHKYLGNGSEGQVFRFNYPEKDIAVKFYKDLPLSGDSVGGIGQFLALKDAHGATPFVTPNPYFASRHLCALEDFSCFSNYNTFLEKHPREKRKLTRYLEDLSAVSGIKIDTADILYRDLVDDFEFLEEDEFPGFEEEPEELENCITLEDEARNSSVFIIEFHSSKKDPEQRYKLGTVDISL